MNSCQAHPAHGTSLRGGGGARPQGVLDPPPLAQHGVLKDSREDLLYILVISRSLEAETFVESL